MVVYAVILETSKTLSPVLKIRIDSYILNIARQRCFLLLNYLLDIMKMLIYGKKKNYSGSNGHHIFIKLLLLSNTSRSDVNFKSDNSWTFFNRSQSLSIHDSLY